MARSRINRLVLATHNKGKLEEFVQLLVPLGVRVTAAGDLGLPEPAETETTFLGNARIKAHAAAHATGLPALSDDSGLEVDALDGAPGVYTADWAETPRGRDFDVAMRKTHDALMRAQASPPWRARFCCTLVLAYPDGEDVYFQGFAHGQLIWPTRGKHGHGYDPMFLPDGETLTFAEMDQAQKARISHRGDAIRKMIDACFT
jgi:XTP/dITP diphosphohydrolase